MRIPLDSCQVGGVGFVRISKDPSRFPADNFEISYRIFEMIWDFVMDFFHVRKSQCLSSQDSQGFFQDS